jgi:hypothetical protein
MQMQLFGLIMMAVLLVSSCTKNDEETIFWKPVIQDDGWQISSGGEQNMDSISLNNLYAEANKLDNLYSLLVIKNGFLVAEKYFNGRSVTEASSTASVTKSITSALTGIAIREQFISGTGQKLKDFFPELTGNQQTPENQKLLLSRFCR